MWFIAAFLPLWMALWLLYSLPYIVTFFGHLSEGDFFYRETNRLSICVTSILLVFGIVACIYTAKTIRICTRRTQDKDLTSNIRFLTNIRFDRRMGVDFMFAYIMPLLAFKFTEFFDVMCFVLLFAFFCFLYIRNNALYLNIFLFLLGYRAYRSDIKMTLNEEDADIQKDILVLYKGNFSKKRYISEKKGYEYVEAYVVFYGNDYAIAERKN